MVNRYIPIGSPVRINIESAHFPGENVWVVDSEPDDEYTYCVSRDKNTSVTAECEWVLGKHVELLDIDASSATTTPVPNTSGHHKSEGDPFEIGDPVVARDNEFFTIRPEVGYVSEIDEVMVGITYAKAGETDILVKRQFVKHA